MGQKLPIGAVASQTGISHRALRLYEEAGLIRPGRTGAGRRIFNAEDLHRLQQVLMLKKAGCTLAEIASMLRRGKLDPVDVIDLQIAVLERQHENIGHVLGSLRAARGQLAEGSLLTIDALCNLIKSGEKVMIEQAWQPVWDKYYTPDEQAKFKAAKQQFSDEDVQAFVRRWAELVSRVEAVIAQGVPPEAGPAIALAREWYDLQKPMVEAVGVGVWSKAATMYKDMDEWQTDAVKSPFSLDDYKFILKAADAARLQGMIPPRMAAA